MSGDPKWKTTGTVYILYRDLPDTAEARMVGITVYATREDAQAARKPGDNILAQKVWRAVY